MHHGIGKIASADNVKSYEVEPDTYNETDAIAAVSLRARRRSTQCCSRLPLFRAAAQKTLSQPASNRFEIGSEFAERHGAGQEA